MADPDLQIREGHGHPNPEIRGGGGGGRSQKNCVFWPKYKGGPPLDPPLLITCSPALSNSTFLSFSFLEPRQRSLLSTSFKEIIMLLEILLTFNRRLLFTSMSRLPLQL